MTVAKEPGHRGEHEVSVKTIAQGMPVDLAEPVVTAACFSCCRRAMGEAFTRHSLRPRSRGTKLFHQFGRKLRRDNVNCCPHAFALDFHLGSSGHSRRIRLKSRSP
jgi:hypothetical protein